MNKLVVARNIKMFREKRLWTQDHLAEAACVSKRTIQRIESGKQAGKETLLSIAAALDIDTELLLQKQNTTQEKPAENSFGFSKYYSS